VTSDTQEIAMWRTSDWSKLASAQASLQRCMVFSPDGRTLAAIPIGGDVHLLDVHTLKELTVLEAPDGSQPRFMDFSPDGNTLVATTSDSRLVQKWNLPLIRSQLHDMNLDWDAPSISSPELIANSRPIQIQVDLGIVHSPR
jgi:WD40 repeat protein